MMTLLVLYFELGWCCLVQAPYKWRHAALAPVKEFLRGEILQNRFKPQFEGGLD